MKDRLLRRHPTFCQAAGVRRVGKGRHTAAGNNPSVWNYPEPGNLSTAKTEYRNPSHLYSLNSPYGAAETLPASFEGWPLRTQGNLWAVLLAGDEGQLPLSLNRALAVCSRERIIAVVAEADRSWWERELTPWLRTNVVVQPRSRGTEFGVLLALLVIAQSDSEAEVIFIPPDHYVEHQPTSPGALSGDTIMMLGISPNAPDSGFGHLSPAPDSGVGVRPVSLLVDLYSRMVPELMSELKVIVERWPESERMSSPDLAYFAHSFLKFTANARLPPHD